MHPLDIYQVLGENQAAYDSDFSKMILDINDLPNHCEAAWLKAQNLRIPLDYRDVDNVVFVGMGGSAIIGDILSTLIASTSKVPFSVYRGYQLPKFVGKRTLQLCRAASGGVWTCICLAPWNLLYAWFVAESQ